MKSTEISTNLERGQLVVNLIGQIPNKSPMEVTSAATQTSSVSQCRTKHLKLVSILVRVRRINNKSELKVKLEIQNEMWLRCSMKRLLTLGVSTWWMASAPLVQLRKTRMHIRGAFLRLGRFIMIHQSRQYARQVLSRAENRKPNTSNILNRRLNWLDQIKI